MSRVIKFRFWSGTKMFYGIKEVMACLVQQISFDNGLKLPIPYDHVGLHGASFMQFTGIFDKNGKEIYEGDIIRYGLYETETEAAIEYTEAVEFITGQFECGTAPLYAVVDWGADVIGNIHENHSLL